MSQFQLDSLGEDFTWGVATAAFQIEGSPDADGKGPSIWDTFSHKKNRLGKTPIQDGTNADVATDSYRRYQDDVELIDKLGFDAYRFSISWPRILPDGVGPAVNEEGLAFYSDLVDELLAHNITPYGR